MIGKLDRNRNSNIPKYRYTYDNQTCYLGIRWFDYRKKSILFFNTFSTILQKSDEITIERIDALVEPDLGIGINVYMLIRNV